LSETDALIFQQSLPGDHTSKCHKGTVRLIIFVLDNFFAKLFVSFFEGEEFFDERKAGGCVFASVVDLPILLELVDSPEAVFEMVKILVVILGSVYLMNFSIVHFEVGFYILLAVIVGDIGEDGREVGG